MNKFIIFVLATMFVFSIGSSQIDVRASNNLTLETHSYFEYFEDSDGNVSRNEISDSMAENKIKLKNYIKIKEKEKKLKEDNPLDTESSITI